jgi:hypothetical protein
MDKHICTSLSTQQVQHILKENSNSVQLNENVRIPKYLMTEVTTLLTPANEDVHT